MCFFFQPDAIGNSACCLPACWAPIGRPVRSVRFIKNFRSWQTLKSCWRLAAGRPATSQAWKVDCSVLGVQCCRGRPLRRVVLNVRAVCCGPKHTWYIMSSGCRATCAKYLICLRPMVSDSFSAPACWYTQALVLVLSIYIWFWPSLCV